MNIIEAAALNAVGTKTEVIISKRPCDQHCMATVAHILDLAGINDVYKGISCTDVAQHWENDPKNFKRVKLEDVQGGDVLFFDGFDKIAGDCDHVGVIVQYDGDISTGLCYVNGNGNNRDFVTEQSMDYARLKKYAARIFRYIGQAAATPGQAPGQQETAAPAINTLQLDQIREGSKGRAVKVLQALLIAAGYSCGPCGADAEFGGATKGAVISYQGESGLEVDGIVGPQTWGKLLE